MHFLLLAELIAVRNIVVNLSCAVALKGPPTEDTIHRFIDRADAEKFRKAEDRIEKLREAAEAARRQPR
jgi:hypothetical protein